ncbi:MAG: hypothetical protein ABIU05_27455 [Nitrospirales bacterium]
MPHYQATQYGAGGSVVAVKPTHKRLDKIGAIRRELEGTACPFCGGHTYRLVLRANTSPQSGGLFARCSQCQRPLALVTAFNRIEAALESKALSPYQAGLERNSP